jgi:hypothetical protein
VIVKLSRSIACSPAPNRNVVTVQMANTSPTNLRCCPTRHQNPILGPSHPDLVSIRQQTAESLEVTSLRMGRLLDVSSCGPQGSSVR